MTDTPLMLQVQAPAPLSPGVEATMPPTVPEGLLDQLLAFLYTLAHWAGVLVVSILEYILQPQNPALLTSLTDPLGYLVLLTAFLFLTEVAKRIAWMIVAVGWVLITVRLIMAMTQTQPF